MKRKVGVDAIVLLVFLIFFAVVTTQIAGRNTAGDEGLRPPHRSTFSAKKGGWKAAYLLLKRSGIPTNRWDTAPSTWKDTASVVVAGEEEMGFGAGNYWNADEAQDAMEWVRRGGTLIMMAALPNAVTDAAKVNTDLQKSMDAVVKPIQPVPYLDGVSGVLMPGGARFTTLGKDATVILADQKPGVVVIKRGAGRIVLVSSPGVIDNAHLASKDNARFFVQLVSAFNDPKRTDGVLWDEFHQGYQEERSFWNAIGQPGQFAFLQLVLLALLICYTTGRRFGLARPALRQDRLSSEYVASLADLYRRARASDAALEAVYLAFWRDLCRAVGMPLDSDSATVARRAAASLGSSAYGPNADQKRAKLQDELQRLLQACEAKTDITAKRLSEHELLALARAIEDMRKELVLGRDERRD